LIVIQKMTKKTNDNLMTAKLNDVRSINDDK